MTAEERRTITGTALVLLVASLIRLGWESRVEPPILPPEPVPEALLAATREALAEEERSRSPLAPGERIDPNVATAVELDRLPGIGPALAGRIVETRTASGGFRSVDELLEVPGIGPVLLERIRQLIVLDP